MVKATPASRRRFPSIRKKSPTLTGYGTRAHGARGQVIQSVLNLFHANPPIFPNILVLLMPLANRAPLWLITCRKSRDLNFGTFDVFANKFDFLAIVLGKSSIIGARCS